MSRCHCGKARPASFIGCEANEYVQLMRDQGIVTQGLFNQADSMIANRISYQFDFSGPSELVNTMCSGFAIALHRAVVALRAYKIDRAIVGAANIMLTPEPFMILSQGDQLSTETTVRSFGRGSAGYLRAEGVGTILIERLDEVKAEYRYCYATIKHTAVNYNGRDGLSIAAPSTAAHTELIKTCYREAGIDPRQLTYIEAQGMGLPVADIAEWTAFNRALTELCYEHGCEPEPGYCRVSTLKPMLGHMHAASSLGALLKIIRSFQTKTFHNVLDYSEPNANCDMDNTPCRIVTQTETWPDSGYARLAALHSYGSGGNNAHILLKEATMQPPQRSITPKPFNLIRCWFKEETADHHPFLQRRVAVGDREGFEVELSGDEFFLKHHGVQGDAIFPGMAYIEMARAAVETAFDKAVVELRRINWMLPMFVRQPLVAAIELYPKDIGYAYRVYSQSRPGQDVNGQGEVSIAEKSSITKKNADIKALLNTFKKADYDKQEFYALMDRLGFNYGESFACVEEIYRSTYEILARIRLPEKYRQTVNQFVLHPAILDSALHAAIYLALQEGQEITDLSADNRNTSIPFFLKSICIYANLQPECYVYLRNSRNSSENTRKIDADLYSKDGHHLVSLREFSSRIISDVKKMGQFDRIGIQDRWLDDQKETTQSSPRYPADKEVPAPKLKATQVDNVASERAEKIVRRAVSPLLQLDDNKVPIDDEISELGFNSINITSLIDYLDKQHDIKLDPVMFFEFSKLRDLSVYIAENFPTRLGVSKGRVL